VPALLARLRQETWQGAVFASLLALGRLGSADAVPALVAALQNPSEMIHETTARALGMLGPRARDAVPALLGALSRKNDLLRRHAVQALGRIGSTEAPVIQALTAALQDPEVFVREPAALALGRLGAAARPALPALEAMMRSDREGEVACAAWALVQIDPAWDKCIAPEVKSAIPAARRHAEAAE